MNDLYGEDLKNDIEQLKSYDPGDIVENIKHSFTTSSQQRCRAGKQQLMPNFSFIFS
jgi:hypothetical protein